jgi:hypothetical protein
MNRMSNVVPLQSVGYNFVVNILGTQFQALGAFRIFINKVKSTGSLLDKKHVKRRHVLTEEKTDEAGLG